jgi:prepilin-type N-terminal cleavage/methylation domain-containing protein
MKNSKNKKGFTLIELLVVVLIIGILAAIALPQYQLAVERARAAQALIMLKAIGQANQRHWLATGSCTKDMRDLDINIKNGTVIQAAHNYIHITDGCFTYETSSCSSDGKGSLSQVFYGGGNCSKYCLEYRDITNIVCISSSGSAKWNSVCQSLGNKAIPTLEPGEYCNNTVAKCWLIQL